MSQESRTLSDLGLEPEKTEKPIKHSEDIWFEDGNVVLQVDRTQFRVHKSILSRHSSVFADMFALPQPDDTSDWVEGCPVIIMSGDEAESWEMVLSTFVYRVTTMSTTWLIVPKVAAMVHLGKKYEFCRLYQEIINLFIIRFPDCLLAYDNSTENFEIWVVRNITGILGIAEEAGLWSIFPVVYYIALTSHRVEGALGIFSPKYNIPAHHLRCLASGRIKLCRAIVEYNFNWASCLWESEGSPPPICTKAASCDKVRGKIVKKAFDQLGYGIRQALGKWSDSVDDSHELCEKCRRYGRRQFENGRERIWSQLGYTFFNDDWDNMTDLDTDTLPTGWGQTST